jgi:hypothetical protein
MDVRYCHCGLWLILRHNQCLRFYNILRWLVCNELGRIRKEIVLAYSPSFSWSDWGIFTRRHIPEDNDCYNYNYTKCFFVTVIIYWNKIHTDYVRVIPLQCLCNFAIVPAVSLFGQQTILWGYPGPTAGQLPEARRWRWTSFIASNRA